MIVGQELGARESMARSLKTSYLLLALGVSAVLALLLGGLAYYEHRVTTSDANQLTYATVEATTDEEWQNILDINLTGIFKVTRAVIPHMRNAGSGRIIGISSRQAESPAATIGAYSASKAAFSSLMLTVALENKDAGITANTILPGTMDTPGNRQAMPAADTSQWVQPASVASLIAWLAGDAGKDVTGAAIPVYGRGL